MPLRFVTRITINAITLVVKMAVIVKRSLIPVLRKIAQITCVNQICIQMVQPAKIMKTVLLNTVMVVSVQIIVLIWDVIVNKIVIVDHHMDVLIVNVM